MKLQDFLGKDEKWSFDAIAEDADLARYVANRKYTFYTT